MIKNFLKIFSYDELPKTFTIFYAVGLLLFAIPFSRPIFIALTPLSLLFVTTLVLRVHPKIGKKFIIFSIVVVLTSFFTEVAGVASGKLFGSYNYLPTLGPGVLDTPYVIGINWLMLTYCSSATVNRFINGRNGPLEFLLKVTTGALIMVIYDLVVELVAPVMGMWQFSSEYPPVENFIMWFVLSLAFHTLLNLMKIKPTGKPAQALFIIQILFFLLIYLIYLIESFFWPSLNFN